MAFYVLYTLILSGILYCTKEIFNQNPGINVFQVACLKSGISFTIVLVTQNVHMKRIMYDGVDRQNIPALMFKTI